MQYVIILQILTWRETDVRDFLLAMMELDNVLQSVCIDHHKATCRQKDSMSTARVTTTKLPVDRRTA